MPPEWSELIACLCAARVRFLIVGAHALAVHGRPRATGDLDLFVDPTPANADRLATALRAFGFPALARNRRAFTQPDRMATLGRVPLRIDLMTSISGVSFRTAWKGRRVVRFGDFEVGVLGREEFVRNKRAAGRTKDLLDVALLEEGRTRRASERAGRRK